MSTATAAHAEKAVKQCAPTSWQVAATLAVAPAGDLDLRAVERGCDVLLRELLQARRQGDETRLEVLDPAFAALCLLRDAVSFAELEGDSYAAVCVRGTLESLREAARSAVERAVRESLASGTASEDE